MSVMNGTKKYYNFLLAESQKLGIVEFVFVVEGRGHRRRVAGGGVSSWKIGWIGLMVHWDKQNSPVIINNKKTSSTRFVEGNNFKC